MHIFCRNVVMILLVFCSASYIWSAESETVRVMSFNLWHGGDEGKQPLEQSAKVIREAKADIIGLQETAGHAPQGKPRRTMPRNWHSSWVGIIKSKPQDCLAPTSASSADIQLPRLWARSHWELLCVYLHSAS